jgi:hypothetical protein
MLNPLTPDTPCPGAVESTAPLADIPAPTLHLLTHHDGSCGVDRLGVRYRPASPTLDPRLLRTYGGRGRRLEGHPMEKVDSKIHCKIRTFPSLAVRLEFNPSRLLYPHTAQIASPEDARRLCHVLLAAMTDYGLEAPLERSTVEIVRVDLARDYLVEDPSAILEMARGTHGRYCRKSLGYFGRDGVIETLSTYTQARRLSLYDKSRENPSRVSSTTLRFEAQLTHKKPIVDSGLRRLPDLCSTTAWAALDEQWTASGFGKRVGGLISGSATPSIAADVPAQPGYLDAAAVQGASR